MLLLMAAHPVLIELGIMFLGVVILFAVWLVQRALTRHGDKHDDLSEGMAKMHTQAAVVEGAVKLMARQNEKDHQAVRTIVKDVATDLTALRTDMAGVQATMRTWSDS